MLVAQSLLCFEITTNKLYDMTGQMNSANEFTRKVVKERSKVFQHICQWAEQVAFTHPLLSSRITEVRGRETMSLPPQALL